MPLCVAQCCEKAGALLVIQDADPLRDEGHQILVSFREVDVFLWGVIRVF